jgi:hypothetical protein
MVLFELSRTSTAPAPVLWEVVTDFAGYGRWMPLTRMRLDAGAPRVGWGFAGFSGLGPVGFTDSMLLTQWHPAGPAVAGCFRVVKTGRVLGGWVAVDVEPHGRGSRLQWREDVVVRPLPLGRALDPLLAKASRWLYGRALDAMTAEADARAGRR